MSQTYNDDLRVATQSVNGGETVNFHYDPDSQLTGVGALTLSRDAAIPVLSSSFQLAPRQSIESNP